MTGQQHQSSSSSSSVMVDTLLPPTTLVTADPTRVEDLLAEDPLLGGTQSSFVFWNQLCLGDWCGLFLLAGTNNHQDSPLKNNKKKSKKLAAADDDDDATVATTPSDSDDEGSLEGVDKTAPQQRQHVHIYQATSDGEEEEDGYEAEHDSDIESVIVRSQRLQESLLAAATAYIEVAPFDEAKEEEHHKTDEQQKERPVVWHHCEGIVSWEETVVVTQSDNTSDEEEGSTSSTVRGVVIQAGLLLLDQQILETQDQEQAALLEQQQQANDSNRTHSNTKKMVSLGEHEADVALPFIVATTQNEAATTEDDDGILAQQQDPPGNYVTDQSDGIGHTPCCSLLRELALIDKEDEDPAPPPPSSIRVATSPSGHRRWTSFGMPRLQRQLLLARGWDPHRRTRSEANTMEMTADIVPLRTQRSLMVDDDEDDASSAADDQESQASVTSVSSISDQSHSSLEEYDDIQSDTEQQEQQHFQLPVVAVVQEDARPQEPETRDDP